MGEGLFSPSHIIIVLVLAAVLFYRGDKLPDMARSVGRSLRVFKTEIKGLTEDDKAREAAQNQPDAGQGHADAEATTRVNTTKAIEASGNPPIAQAAPRIVPAASAPIPVHAEIVREPSAEGSRPRPRPAGSAPRQ